MNIAVNKKIIIPAASVIALIACSESAKVSGGTIEDQNAITEAQVSEWYDFGLDAKEAAYTIIDGGRLAVLNDSTGARAECTADSSTLSMTIQIPGTTVISTLKADGLNNSCDSIFTAFKDNCADTPNSEFYSISKGCKGGAFDAACRTSAIASDSISAMLKKFNNLAAERCSEITKNAQFSTGIYETMSSGTTTPKSSSSFTEQGTSTCENCETTPPDTAVTIDSSRTLENYILQYAASEEELSFDSRVIAYNGSISNDCIKSIEGTAHTVIKDLYDKLPLFPILLPNIESCFPMTAKIMEGPFAEKNCQYLMAIDYDAGQPTAHVLSHIGNDEVEFTGVKPSGECSFSAAIEPILFLIEDCEYEIQPDRPQITYKTFESEIWRCEDDTHSPSPRTTPYLEWFK